MSGSERFVCFLAVLLVCLAPSSFAARTPDLSPLNDQLAKEIVSRNIRSVFVADFLSPEGLTSALGWYVADQLSENWFYKKPEFRVVDRSDVTDTMVRPADLQDAQIIKMLGSVWGVDAIITGIVDPLPDRYAFNVTTRTVADNSVAVTVSGFLPRSRMLDLLRPMHLDKASPLVARAGVNGVTVPVCLRCPVPLHTDRRQARAQGTIVLSVLVSEAGRVENIQITRKLGYGLTEDALENVSEWTFIPARNSVGEAVAVVVPVEVTFRMSWQSP